jgi:hypothetical protein
VGLTHLTWAMKKISTLFAVFVLLTQVVGCADTPEVLVHDLLVFWNELGDYQLLAYNEAAAKEMFDKDNDKAKMFKERYDTIKERMDKKVLVQLEKDKDVQLNLKNAVLDYYDEAAGTAKRLHGIHKRMNAIIWAILNEDMAERERREPEKGKPSPNWKLVENLVKVRNWVDVYLLATPGGGTPGGGGGNVQGTSPEAMFNALKPNPIFTGDVIKSNGVVVVKWGDGLMPEPYEYKKRREEIQKGKK